MGATANLRIMQYQNLPRREPMPDWAELAKKSAEARKTLLEKAKADFERTGQSQGDAMKGGMGA